MGLGERMLGGGGLSRDRVAHHHVSERARHSTAGRPTHPLTRRFDGRGLPRCCAVGASSWDSEKAS